MSNFTLGELKQIRDNLVQLKLRYYIADLDIVSVSQCISNVESAITLQEASELEFDFDLGDDCVGGGCKI